MEHGKVIADLEREMTLHDDMDDLTSHISQLKLKSYQMASLKVCSREIGSIPRRS
jgi:hypothetical protein